MPKLDLPLGAVSLGQFLRRHWQRRPLLVRQAIAGFASPVSPAELYELAGRDEVESRLITSAGARWRLDRGPFEAADLPSLRRRHWTLLVQGVDQQLDRVHDLLGRFRFINDARLDDLMISIAGDGGGVGPHLDSYDVFLLQASGRRRWRWGPTDRRDPPPFKAGLPLKILQHFEPAHEAILEPGDLLYLPPGVAHEGTAVGACMTFSIGFRAPSRLEYLRAWLGDAADEVAGADPRYVDRPGPVSTTPAEIPLSLERQLARWARAWRPTERDLRRFNGRFLTEPKANVWFEPPARTFGPLPFARQAARHGLRIDRRTRIAYRGRDLFINGECFPGAAVQSMRSLADARALHGAALVSAIANRAVTGLLHQWWAQGWIKMDNAVQKS